MSQLSTLINIIPAPVRRVGKAFISPNTLNRIRTKLREDHLRQDGQAGLNKQGLIAIVENLAGNPTPVSNLDANLEGLGVEFKGSEYAGVEIEINDSCNINCRMCDTASASRKKGLMDLSLFENSLLKLAEAKNRNILLHTIGDPLANRNLARYLELVRKHKFRISSLSTNFLMMDRHIDTVFEYRDVIDTIRPSIDGCSKEVYEHIRDGGNFDTLIRNLIQFVDRNATIRDPFSIWINCSVSRDNFHEIAFLPQVFGFVADPIFFNFSFINSLAPSQDYFFKTRMFEDFYVLNQPCGQLWSAPHVLKDGSLTTCCRDYDGDLVFGHINDGPLGSSYNNDKIKTLRKAHLDGNDDEIPNLCRTCYSMDSRINVLFNNLIQYFYIDDLGHPARLKVALDSVADSLQKRDFHAAVDIIDKL